MPTNFTEYKRRRNNERWTSPQKLVVYSEKVALSSAEAELAACIKASSETIGILQMVAGLGRTTDGEVFVDSSAALGVVNRKGNGKLRHIRVGQLWVQQMAEDEVIAYKKVNGKQNPADLCTKNLTQGIIDHGIAKVEMEIRAGRAEMGLEANRLEPHINDSRKKVSWADMQEEEEKERG